jgi:hypothetical protein
MHVAGLESSRMNQSTYTAFYQDDHAAIIYRGKLDDGALDKLPQKAVPANDDRSTLNRTDGGDRYEFALFRTDLGQLIVVQRD